MGTSLGIRKVKRGPVRQWNRANPDKQVKPGHAIVMVNGSYGNTAKLLQAISAANVLDMVLVPIPADESDSDSESSDSLEEGEIRIKVEKRTEAGLGIHFHHAPTSLKISKI